MKPMAALAAMSGFLTHLGRKVIECCSAVQQAYLSPLAGRGRGVVPYSKATPQTRRFAETIHAVSV